jgi:hypothetical protein
MGPRGRITRGLTANDPGLPLMLRKLSPIALVLRLPSEVAQEYGRRLLNTAVAHWLQNVSALDLVGTKVV